ncbi:MAG TPA: MFS transporter [bacterium]|nr:MFS transporter [bacterium]
MPAGIPARPRILALYGSGALGASVLLQTILLWLVYFYAPPAGQGAALLPPTLVGLALAVGRVVNALSNPPVAFWSDRSRTRWGRRRPFIAIGAPALAACFVLLWRPPAAPQSMVFVYVAAALAGFFFLFSLVMNPYAAMLPEITPGGRGRAAAASWQAGASLGGVGVAMIASPWLIQRWGFGTMGVVLAAFALACLWIVSAGGPAVRSAPGHQETNACVPAGDAASESGAATPRGAFLAEVAAVLRHRGFRVYLWSLALLWLGTSMVNTTVVYVVTVLMDLGRDHVALVLGAAFACTVAALPLLARVSRTLGTARALTWTLGAATAVVPLIGVIGLRGMPFAAVAQGYAVIVLAAVPLAGLLVLPNILLADIAEADGVASGEGREAMFYAVQGLALNGATALSSVLLGLLLSLGYSPGQALGLRLIPVVAGACTLAALLVFRSFPGAAAAARRDVLSR